MAALLLGLDVSTGHQEVTPSRMGFMCGQRESSPHPGKGHQQAGRSRPNSSLTTVSSHGLHWPGPSGLPLLVSERVPWCRTLHLDLEVVALPLQEHRLPGLPSCCHGNHPAFPRRGLGRNRA